MPQRSNEVRVLRGTIEAHTYAELRVEIPAGSLINSVTAEARNEVDAVYGPCVIGGECAPRWCQFVGNYNIREEEARRVIPWTFANWSHNHDRYARVTVDYT